MIVNIATAKILPMPLRELVFHPAEAVTTGTGLCVAGPLGLAAQHVPFSLPTVDAKLNVLSP